MCCRVAWRSGRWWCLEFESGGGMGREEAEKCNCEARNIWRRGWKAVAEFIGGIKDWSRARTGFFYVRVWSVFCWKIWFLLFITDCRVIVILVVYIFGFIG